MLSGWQQQNIKNKQQQLRMFSTNYINTSVHVGILECETGSNK